MWSGACGSWEEAQRAVWEHLAGARHTDYSRGVGARMQRGGGGPKGKKALSLKALKSKKKRNNPRPELHYP